MGERPEQPDRSDPSEQRERPERPARPERPEQRRQAERRNVPWRLLLLLVAVFIATVGITGALQPRVANHFGYALPGKDGLPTYIYANDRRYHSTQVCAGADWCERERLQQLIPRCYTQANLESLRLWPLAQVSTMFTLFGAPRQILAPVNKKGLTRPFVMADGSDCYVVYTLEGAP